MKKIFYVAQREFLSTVLTKGFIFGVLVTPLAALLLVLLIPKLMSEAPPRVEGEVAIVDPTGVVGAGVAAYLDPQALAERRGEQLERMREVTGGLAGLPGMDGAASAGDMMEQILGEVPLLDVVELRPGADIEAEKQKLIDEPERGLRLALIEIDADAVPTDGPPGSYSLWVRSKLDDRIEDEIRDALRESIRDARIRAAGLDREVLDHLMWVARPESTTVSVSGERTTSEVFNMLLPMSFMLLLVISVLTSGQYLMTTTIEEKSSRVVEVLLSAVSPLELMTGKIVGQLAVGLVILALYSSLGIAALLSFAMMGLVEPMLFVYLFIFYLLAYFFIGSVMAAIGAAVNELREAQTLMAPVMMLVMGVWILWMPISRNPESTLALVTSFIPPLSSFVMLLRLTSSAPPPWWQVWLAILVSAVSVWFALQAAAKVFRVGLLMHGKPPSFRTLLRWIRQA